MNDTPDRHRSDAELGEVRLPSEAEAEALSKANPKGRLYEFCQKTKCAKPKLVIEQKATAWGVAMRMRSASGRELESGMHWARGRLLAEQLAAQALLARLGAEEEGEPEEWITNEDAERLRLENPKGKLLERCVVERLEPVFDVRPVATTEGLCFEASAHVELANGEEVWSDIRRGASGKAVEQAVAASLLERLTEALHSAAAVPSSSSPDARASRPVGGEPRCLLNELRQRGRLRDHGFDVARIEGPPHAPVFHMRGYAVRKTGERLEVNGISAPTKKEGERLVALRLVDLLRADEG